MKKKVVLPPLNQLCRKIYKTIKLRTRQHPPILTPFNITILNNFVKISTSESV